MHRNSIYSDLDDSTERGRDSKKQKKAREEQLLKYYDGDIKAILISAKLHYRVFLLAVNAYPSECQMVVASKDSFVQACQEVYGRSGLSTSFHSFVEFHLFIVCRQAKALQ